MWGSLRLCTRVGPKLDENACLLVAGRLQGATVEWRAKRGLCLERALTSAYNKLKLGLNLARCVWLIT